MINNMAGLFFRSNKGKRKNDKVPPQTKNVLKDTSSDSSNTFLKPVAVDTPKESSSVKETISSVQPSPGMSLFSGLNLTDPSSKVEDTEKTELFTESSNFSFISGGPRNEGASMGTIIPQVQSDVDKRMVPEGASMDHPIQEKEEGFGFVTHPSDDPSEEGFDFVTRPPEEPPEAGFDFMTQSSEEALTSSRRSGEQLQNTSVVPKESSNPPSAQLPVTCPSTSPSNPLVTAPSSEPGKKGARKKKTKAMRPGLPSTHQCDVKRDMVKVEDTRSVSTGVNDGVSEKTLLTNDDSFTNADHERTTGDQLGMAVEQCHSGIEQPREKIEQLTKDGVEKEKVIVESKHDDNVISSLLKPDSDTESSTQPETGSSTQPGSESSTQPETESSTQPEAESSTQPEAGSSTQPETGSSTQPEAGSSTQLETGSSTQPETGSSTQPETGSSTQPGTESPLDPGDDSITDSVIQQDGDKDTPLMWQGKTEEMLAAHKREMSELNCSIAALRVESAHQFEDLLCKGKLRIETHNEQRKLKEEEATALEEENYSLAEELKEQIEEKNLLLTGSRPLVEELVEALPVVVDKFTEAFKRETTGRVLAMETVAQCKDNLTGVLDALEGQHRDFMSLKDQELSKLQETVTEQRSEVARRSDKVNKREEELNSMIQEKCEGFQTEKDVLEAEMETLEEEMLDLEKRLKTLRERKKTVSVEIKQQERNIIAAQRSLAKDQQLVEEEKSITAKQQEQLKVAEAALEAKKENIEVSIETHRHSIEAYVAVMDTLSDQVNSHKTRLDAIAMEMEYMSSFTDEFLPSFSASEKLQCLLEEEGSMSALVHQLADKVVKGQTRLMEMRGLLSEVRTSLPQVEDAKKAAVTARNYKEAGRLNEKLKNLVTEETSLATEVEALLAELEETSSKLDEAKRELSITEQKRSKEEESSELSQLETLSRCCEKIEEVKSKTTDKENSPFCDLMDHCLQILNCLKEEIKAKMGSS